MKLRKAISLFLVLVLLTSPVVALAALAPETDGEAPPVHEQGELPIPETQAETVGQPGKLESYIENPEAFATPATTAPGEGETDPEPLEPEQPETDDTAITSDDGIVHENTPEEMGLLEWDDPDRKGRISTFAIPNTTALGEKALGTLINIPYVVNGVTYANPAVIVERNHSPYGTGTILKFQKSQAQVYFYGNSMTWQCGSYENSNYRSYMKNSILPKIKTDIKDKIISVSLPIGYSYNTQYNTSPPYNPTSSYTTTVSDKLWVPSSYEIQTENSYLGNGSTWANTPQSGVKTALKADSTEVGMYALRSLIHLQYKVDSDGYRSNIITVRNLDTKGSEQSKSASITRSPGQQTTFPSVTLSDFLTNVEPFFMLPNDIAVSNTKNANGTYDLVFNIAPTTPTGMTAPTSVNSWDTDTVEFSWNASTDANGDSITYPMEISVNGGAWSQVQNTSSRSYTRTISVPGDSYYQVRVRAYDGKEYSAYLTSGIVTITHDTTNPTIQAVAVPDATENGSWAKDKVDITVIVSDGGSGLDTLTVPDGVTPSGNQTLSGATATKVFTASKNGIFTFIITDKAGNSAAASVSPSKIDADDPTITYTTDPPDGEFTNGDATINLTFADASSGLLSYSSLNGTESLSGNIASQSFTAPANGVYPFSVTDLVGHTTAINVNINMIDRDTPVTVITPQVQSWTNSPSVLLDITASDDYAGINKIILPDMSEHTGSSAAYEITGNGSYSVYSLDKAGNVSDVATVNYPWFDRTRPTVRSVAFVPINNFIVKWFSDLLGFNQHVRIEVTGDDTPEDGEGESGVATMHYRVLGGSGNVVKDWTQVAYGSKPEIDYDVNGSVEVYVKDTAGNVSNTETYDILVDLTPPVVAYTLSTDGETYDSVVATLTITDEPDGSGAKGFLLPDGNIFAAQAQITYTFEENGVKYFTGYDRAGNSTEIAVEVSNIVAQPLDGDWENNQVVINAVLHATGKRAITDVTYVDMQKIIYLDLSYNKLTSLPAVLANAHNLEHLDLRGNEFTEIPDCVFEFARLRYLDLSNNNIADVSSRISELKFLETLDLRLNYLTDYSLPAIVPNYYDEGNFTLNGSDGQYSFRFLPHDDATEPIGNTVQLSVEWSYGGEPISGDLEDHRKELYSSFYPLYRTYRPLLYRYDVNNGQFKTGTPDYVQMQLLNQEAVSATLKLGAAS